MLLGILGNPWSVQDGRVEVDPDPAVPASNIPMVNPEVEARPTVTKTRNEENVRRTNFTKKMVSEFGATLGCTGCVVIGQPHTEECAPGSLRVWRTIFAHAQKSHFFGVDCFTISCNFSFGKSIF